MFRLALVALLLAAFASTAPSHADAIPDDVGARVAQGFAQPAAQAFATRATALVAQMQTLCAEPDATTLDTVRSGFGELVAAWGPLSALRFGPLQADNRYERIFFWPDPRGVILRQVQGLLAEGDEAALVPGALEQKSVAVQGLPALEFALYGAGADELSSVSDSYRCRYGAAIAANIAGIAEDIVQGWSAGPFHAAFTRPSADRSLYRTDTEVAGEIVKAIGTALQFTRNAELTPALGETADEARGKRAPLWRSDLTFTLLGERLGGLRELLAATGFDEDPTVAAYVGSLDFELSHARDALGAVTATAEEAFADPDDRARLVYVSVALHGANEATGGNLSGALGLTMGFNALDGD